MENETVKNRPLIRPIPKTSVIFSQKNYLLFVVFGLVIIVVSVFVGIQIGKSQINSQSTVNQKITEQPSVTSSNKDTYLEEKNKIIKAGLYIPSINDKYSDTWTAYINWDYNFSFLFPAKWRVDLSDDHMSIKSLMCRGCGGGFSGISITYKQNENKQPINEYISKLRHDMAINNIELYKTKNNNITVYVDRQTPGAGPGQTAFIANTKGVDVVEVYCGDCSNTEMNNIISSFDFEVERDQTRHFF